MLITFRDSYMTEDSDLDLEVEVPFENGYVVPDCCEEARTLATVILRYDYEDLTDEGGTFQKATPRWSLGWHPGVAERMYRQGAIPAPKQPRYCPYCAAALPEVRRRADAPRTHTPIADGDYCGTCDQRSMACQCAYPEMAWETIPPSAPSPSGPPAAP